MAFLDETQRSEIEAAIRAAEQRTSGEFVAVVARASDEYLFLPTLYAAIAALAIPPIAWAAISLLATAPADAWSAPSDLAVGLVYALQVATFVVLALALRWPPLTMLVVPRHVKLHRARRLAHELFFRLGLHETRERTGVLLFVSVGERYVEIIADRGIHEKAPPGMWEQVVADFTGKVKAGRVSEGFTGAIAACGGLLAEHFPRAAGARSQLPDVLIQI